MAWPQFPVTPKEYFKFNNKCLFISCDSLDVYETKLHGTKCVSVARHDDDLCQVSENCSYHILIFDETVRKPTEILEKHCRGVLFHYQEVDCLFTLYKQYFHGNIMEQRGNLFNQLKMAITFTTKHKHFEKLPSIAKKRLLRKKLRLYGGGVTKKSTSTQTMANNAFDTRISLIRKSKYEIDLMKIIDCMLDQQGSVDSNNVHFYCK